MKHDAAAGPVELRGNRDMKLILHGGNTSQADIMFGISAAEEFGFGDGQE